MIHSGWKRMLANTILSNIENARQKKGRTVEKHNAHISNNKIFQDLDYVFNHIDGYKKLYIKLFEDMSEFNFVTTSSVTDVRDDISSEYGEIKLYEHTLNSFKQMVLLVKNSSEYKIQKDIYLLIALLHDFGKSHELCKYFKINLDDKHHIRSAKYFEKIINNSTDDYFGIDEASFKIIFNTLQIHHELTDEDTKKNNFLVALKKADGGARLLEKKFLEKKGGK